MALMNFRQDSFKGPAHYNTKRPWAILFNISGSVWCSVLPYCILNCGITYLLYFLRRNNEPKDQSKFSAQGHALMSLIVSYLVVSKVYVSLDRYMEARATTGRTMASLRELNQQQLVFSQPLVQRNSEVVSLWRTETRAFIINLLDSTVLALQDDRRARWLARNEGTVNEHDTSDGIIQDPLIYTQLLREHIYSGQGLPDELPLLVRSKMLDTIHLFSESYTEVLRLASTPLAFPLVQLGRTFLFLYTFTLPLALMGLVMDASSMFSVQMFVFFLTYGFVGLEFVSMKLLHPFGKDPNDIQLEALAEATLRGIRADTASAGKRGASNNQTASPLRLQQIREAENEVFDTSAKESLEAGVESGAYHSMR